MMHHTFLYSNNNCSASALTVVTCCSFSEIVFLLSLIAKEDIGTKMWFESSCSYIFPYLSAQWWHHWHLCNRIQRYKQEAEVTAAISIGAFLLLKPLFQTGCINHTVSGVLSFRLTAVLGCALALSLLSVWLFSPRHVWSRQFCSGGRKMGWWQSLKRQKDYFCACHGTSVPTEAIRKHSAPGYGVSSAHQGPPCPGQSPLCPHGGSSKAPPILSVGYTKYESGQGGCSPVSREGCVRNTEMGFNVSMGIKLGGL